MVLRIVHYRPVNIHMKHKFWSLGTLLIVLLASTAISCQGSSTPASTPVLVPAEVPAVTPAAPPPTTPSSSAPSSPLAQPSAAVSPVTPAKPIAPAPAQAPTPTPPVTPRFSTGIYYRALNASDPGGTLAKIGEALPAFTGVPLPPTYFTMDAGKLVITDNQNTVLIYAPDGKLQKVKAAGLYQMSRPSLSPDGNRVAVQAAEVGDPQPQDLNIYVVDLTTGKWERISDLLTTPEEAPRWFPTSNLVAYTSFSADMPPEQGLAIHIYDVDAHKEVRQVTGEGGAGGLNIAVSPDEKIILNSNTMTLYDIQTGTRVAQLRSKIEQALQSQGFQSDSRFPGQANRGTLTLHGNFSPDGRSIVFDGAAQKSDAYGLYIARVSTTGDDFQLLLDLIPNNPAFSNNNNYSQMSPFWLK